MMRRAKRKEILHVFKTLHQVHDIIKKMPDVNLLAENEVLPLCQNGAIQIGNEIEQWEGEGTRTVSILEDYCEAVYQCVKPDTVCTGKDIFWKLEEILIQAENCFQEEVKVDKLEAVFFPYNASMWGSLESVWRAANQDPACDAYVVPIPYFERKPDGTFGEMHYEGKQFPEDVPIISWEEYDVAARCPDMIFIHNPYDQNNYVTSVHPNYYASVLKKYTANLVYIPYYLFVEQNVYESTVMTSAALYADYFVVQEGGCYTKCVQIYDSFLRKNNLAGKLKPGRDKFLPFGSPIEDSLHKPVSKDNIPQVWRNIINQKVTGWEENYVKIILYSTSLGNVMMLKAEHFFEKLESVFQIFKAQKDIILLWRPHPLTLQTIHSMNPKAEGRYQQIVDQYKEEGWGIYDDTSDVNRAVAMSDAYYGDWSSLMTMFQLLGKPVMRQTLKLDVVKAQSDDTDGKAFIEEYEMGLPAYLASIKKHRSEKKEDLCVGNKVWNYLYRL